MIGHQPIKFCRETGVADSYFPRFTYEPPMLKTTKLTSRWILETMALLFLTSTVAHSEKHLTRQKATEAIAL